MNTCEVYGSHGELTVHRATGYIIDRIPDSSEDPGYESIYFFDPATLVDGPQDILATGYFDVYGHARPHYWTAEDDGCAGGYWGQELLLLEGPDGAKSQA